jgi:hypothetical protein
VAAVLAAEAPRARVHRKKGLLKGGARLNGPARDDGAGGAIVAGHRGPLGAARRCPGAPPPWGRPPPSLAAAAAAAGGGAATHASGAAAGLTPAQLLAGACSADAIAARHALAVRASAQNDGHK